MKNWFVAFLAALWLLPSEAASVTKKIGVQDFTGVVAGGIYDVTLIRADVCSVEVTCEADMADDLRIAVKKGRLVLEIDQSGWSSAERKKFSDLRPKAVVRLPVLSYLEIGGACRMETSGRFDAGERFDGRISGAASLSELCVGGESGNWDISGAASVRIDREVRRIALCGIGGGPGYRLGDRRERAGRDDRSRLVTVKHIRCFLFLCRGDGSSLRNGYRADRVV